MGGGICRPTSNQVELLGQCRQLTSVCYRAIHAVEPMPKNAVFVPPGQWDTSPMKYLKEYLERSILTCDCSCLWECSWEDRNRDGWLMGTLTYNTFFFAKRMYSFVMRNFKNTLKYVTKNQQEEHEHQLHT